MRISANAYNAVYKELTEELLLTNFNTLINVELTDSYLKFEKACIDAGLTEIIDITALYKYIVEFYFAINLDTSTEPEEDIIPEFIGYDRITILKDKSDVNLHDILTYLTEDIKNVRNELVLDVKLVKEAKYATPADWLFTLDCYQQVYSVSLRVLA